MLKKARQNVLDCEVVLEAERADAVPAVFTKIEMVYRIAGTELSKKQVDRAVSLSAEKYCSVSKMLEESVEITHRVEISPDSLVD